jgi:hypothetical protein
VVESRKKTGKQRGERKRESKEKRKRKNVLLRSTTAGSSQRVPFLCRLQSTEAETRSGAPRGAREGGGGGRWTAPRGSVERMSCEGEVGRKKFFFFSFFYRFLRKSDFDNVDEKNLLLLLLSFSETPQPAQAPRAREPPSRGHRSDGRSERRSRRSSRGDRGRSRGAGKRREAKKRPRHARQPRRERQRRSEGHGRSTAAAAVERPRPSRATLLLLMLLQEPLLLRRPLPGPGPTAQLP